MREEHCVSSSRNERSSFRTRSIAIDPRRSVAFKVTPTIADQFEQAVRETPIKKQDIMMSLMIYFTQLSLDERLAFVATYRPSSEQR
jgi:hypothetical protein